MWAKLQPEPRMQFSHHPMWCNGFYLFDLSVTNHTSATGPLGFKAKKPQLLKTIPEVAEQTLRAACAAASPHPKHMEGQQGTHSMQLAHTGYLSRDGAGSQGSALSKCHSLSSSPKSSWEVQYQFCLEKARLQGLFLPLCCTVPCIKYSASIPTERTILVFLPTDCLYLKRGYKRAWRELWWWPTTPQLPV